VLVLDVGGTNVKLYVGRRAAALKIPSGRSMTPDAMLAAIREAAGGRGREFDAVSIGVPAPVLRGRILREPVNLGPGWVAFDFEKASPWPVRVVNDAAMQALGSYRGGTMLFLGLGTGLGSALVVDGVLVPMELARLPYRRGEIEDYVGLRGMKAHGKRRWRRHVADVVALLRAAFVADEVVLGGGNAARLDALPEGCRLGSNALARVGGERLWDDEAERRRYAVVTPAPSRPRVRTRGSGTGAAARGAGRVRGS
jgi:predicted NBD/HSP70 family sugar kinase